MSIVGNANYTYDRLSADSTIVLPEGSTVVVIPPEKMSLLSTASRASASQGSYSSSYSSYHCDCWHGPVGICCGISWVAMAAFGLLVGIFGECDDGTQPLISCTALKVGLGVCGGLALIGGWMCCCTGAKKCGCCT